MKIKVSKLIENEENPRFINEDEFKKLVKSIKEFPEMLKLRPIVVDVNNVVLGGNMRLKAIKELGFKECDYAIFTPEMSEKMNKENGTSFTYEEHCSEFIIKDNGHFGQWDWDLIANEWHNFPLDEWGVSLPGYDVEAADLDDSFSIPDGEKSPFQQMTVKLSDEQVQAIQSAIKDAKELEEFKYIETFGNENSNGNALYLIISQWVEQRK